MNNVTAFAALLCHVMGSGPSRMSESKCLLEYEKHDPDRITAVAAFIEKMDHCWSQSSVSNGRDEERFQKCLTKP